jgi:hypothetical protein
MVNTILVSDQKPRLAQSRIEIASEAKSMTEIMTKFAFWQNRDARLFAFSAAPVHRF